MSLITVCAACGVAAAALTVTRDNFPTLPRAYRLRPDPGAAIRRCGENKAEPNPSTCNSSLTLRFPQCILPHDHVSVRVWRWFTLSLPLFFCLSVAALRVARASS
uniref:Secreted protein n=1 Tax=Anopheles darlingi TaxID=43151 RepID=A0A2M4DMJ9_ANODA